MTRPELTVDVLTETAATTGDGTGTGTGTGDPTDAFAVKTEWRDARPGGGGRVTGTNTASTSVDADLRITATVAGSSDPWWLIPGAFYGENRPAENTRAFPRFEIGASSAEAHSALISDAWEFRADRAATPAVFVWAAPGVGGVALAAAESTGAG